MHWDRADYYGKEKRRNAAKEESHVRNMANGFPVEVVQFLHAYLYGSSTGATAFLEKKYPIIMEETKVALSKLKEASRDDFRAYFALFTRI